MSEIVHYIGKAKKVKQPIGMSLNDVAKKILKQRGKEIANYYDSALECLIGSFYKEFFYYKKTETLYQLDNIEYDPDDDIIKAHQNKDGTVDYELRYYNGGAGFDECLEEAFDNL